MANGIDTPMKRVEAITLEADVDRLSRDAPLDQLFSGHDPVLPVRERGNSGIQPTRSFLTVHNTVNDRVAEVRPRAK